jgi:NAD(P)H dehydrogenase (quinone)
MSVLPPFVTYDIGRGRVPPERYEAISRELQARILAAESTKPIPYRYQNRGDYDDNLVLLPGLEGDRKGLAIHLLDEGIQPLWSRREIEHSPTETDA